MSSIASFGMLSLRTIYTYAKLMQCHRMVTVRELARSQGFPDNFVFEAFENNVVTVGVLPSVQTTPYF